MDEDGLIQQSSTMNKLIWSRNLQIVVWWLRKTQKRKDSSVINFRFSSTNFTKPKTTHKQNQRNQTDPESKEPQMDKICSKEQKRKRQWRETKAYSASSLLSGNGQAKSNNVEYKNYNQNQFGSHWLRKWVC